eukprot:COSAG01_NODE_7135_length_3335_cov_7.411001_2_plen_48_part_00
MAIDSTAEMPRRATVRMQQRKLESIVQTTAHVQKSWLCVSIAMKNYI